MKISQILNIGGMEWNDTIPNKELRCSFEDNFEIVTLFSGLSNPSSWVYSWLTSIRARVNSMPYFTVYVHVQIYFSEFIALDMITK